MLKGVEADLVYIVVVGYPSSDQGEQIDSPADIVGAQGGHLRPVQYRARFERVVLKY